MTQQRPPFPIPPVNFWDGNQFVVPGYTQGYDLPVAPPAPPPVPPVTPPVLPPILPPNFYARTPYGPAGRRRGLLDMSFVQR